ncbi:MAG: hypothetical protein KKD64_08960 [Alphaproteobacteria bacterium]|nr:hypothetical protein [Alphaproteobacteria bacterium]MBU0794105.1 hypothetical protein [Alphaproteobacteria bacterium]MBU0876800.1 hypothetical protein [Alphaproteobacteria bacterium]MBU1769770.1 hypothetical protein [Alphaproteobacteria bacterium]
MKSAGQPLRFLAVVLGCWVCIRGAMLLWPIWATGDPLKPRLAVIASVDADGAVPSIFRSDSGQVEQLSVPAQAGGLILPRRTRAGSLTGSAAQALRAASGVSPAAEPSTVAASMAKGVSVTMITVPTGAGASAGRPNSRWSGQAWLLWRPDAGGGRAFAPLLGGSQAGVRIDYRLTSGAAGTFSLYGRASRALERPFAEEGAVGLAWRPASWPVSLMVERRQRLGPGGRNGFAVLAAGGLNPTEIAPHVEAEGYAQAGFVGLPGGDGFADGKGTLSYRLMPQNDRLSVNVGGALSGSVQPGARRLDVGPEVRLRLPSGRHALRLSAEWRMRVAGNARPASGPAVTLVTDF